MTALKHVTMRLMSSWQRLSGSGVGPESGPLDPRAWHRSRIRYLSKNNSRILTNFPKLKKFVKIRTKIRKMPEWAWQDEQVSI